MAEKMLVTQALDERDLLAKKIRDKIEKIRLVDCKKRNEDKTVTDRVSAEEFAKNAESAYQQIMDLIDRYQRLESAIIASNASTYVETSRGKLSVAAAIALRNRLRISKEKEVNFEDILAFNLEEQYHEHLDYAETKNKGIETQAEAMRLSILGRDSKVKDDKPLGVVDAYIRENTTELIDPLNVQQKIQKLREESDTLLKELETKIKVSNATTTIEF